MPFPLPLDPKFRLEVTEAWLDDIEERLSISDHQGADRSWKIANSIYLSLPPGYGDPGLEDRLYRMRVKLNQQSQ
jgi:hypothetical protein